MATPRKDPADLDLSYRTSDVHSVLAGVSIPWLMKAFRMGKQTCERKLRGCKPIGSGKHGSPLYDLAEASAYLVKPKVDLAAYIATLKPDALPENLRDPYWSAMLKKQRWEEKAAHLWDSERVIELFSEVLSSMRMRLQLLPDEVERVCGLSPANVETVRHLVDELQADMHQTFINFAASGTDTSQLGSYRAENPEPIRGRDNDDLV